MASKNKLEKTAEVMFIKQGKQQKEIAQSLGLSEKTVSNWARDGKWKDKRTAEMNTSEKRANDIKEVIANLTERRLEIFKEVAEANKAKDKKLVFALNKEAVGIGQEVAMQTKALLVMDKSGKPSLTLYLEIMDAIFKAMQAFDGNLYLKSLDFQEKHLSDVAELLA